MPYLLAHTSFGYDVHQALDAPFSGDDAALFYLGCLGPDIYFFDALPPPLFRRHQKRLGNRMHDLDAAALFSALLHHADARHAPFLCGMLCHLALDATAHPYVTACTTGNDHTRLEVAIDMRLFPATARAVGLPFALQRNADAALADALMAAAADELFGSDVRGAYLRGASNLRNVIVPLTYDPHGRKRRIVSAVEHAVRKENALSGFLLTEAMDDVRDVCNFSHRPWTAPAAPGCVRHEDMETLYQRAIPQACTLIRAYRAGGADALLPLLHGCAMNGETGV